MTSPTPPPGRIRALAALAADLPRPAVLAAGIALCAAAWAATTVDWNSLDSFTLRGSLILSDEDAFEADGMCIASDGYGDISEGTEVTVYDAEGSIIATGSLSKETFVEAEDSLDTNACQYTVRVPDVPGGHDFYQVEIGHRGKVRVTEPEARAGQFAASLG